MRDASFYDATYFDGAGKSNYSKYTETTANFAAYADAVQTMLGGPLGLLNARVLDIGCAKGYLVRELRQRGVAAFGIDVSPYAIAQAPEDVRPYLKVGSIFDLLNINYIPPPYDLAVTFDVLEHFDEAHARQALRAAALASTRQLHQVNTGWCPEVAFDGDESHVLKLPLSEWRRLAREEGCVNTTIVETGRGEVQE